MGRLRIDDLIPDFLKRVTDKKAISGHEVYKRLINHPLTILAVNVRFLHTIPGILRAAEEMDAIVSFELGTEAGNLKGGFTGLTPSLFVESLFNMMEKMNFTKPFILHADHIQRPDSPPVDIGATKELFLAEHKAGFTSFSVDTTNLPDEDILAGTIELAKFISGWKAGLEIAMGEIEGTKGDLTTLEEVENVIIALYREGIKPDLLAISNGSRQGIYKNSDSRTGIDLERTLEIWKDIKDRGIGIAQHGVTGIPLPVIRQFPRHGIKKANVATLWQSIVHEALPTELFDRMKYWAEIEGVDIRYASSRFATDLAELSDDVIKRIEQNTYVAATELIESLGGLESASLLESLL